MTSPSLSPPQGESAVFMVPAKHGGGCFSGPQAQRRHLLRMPPVPWYSTDVGNGACSSSVSLSLSGCHGARHRFFSDGNTRWVFGVVRRPFLAPVSRAGNTPIIGRPLGDLNALSFLVQANRQIPNCGRSGELQTAPNADGRGCGATRESPILLY